MGLRFGTCSWNYDSWVGLVYTRTCSTAAAYLREYAQKYGTAEVDSWFYKFPPANEVAAYKEAVPGDFAFTVKVTQDICLTHFRQKRKSDPLVKNPKFLSADALRTYLDNIAPLLPRVAAVMLEFEYLNRQKIPSLPAFLSALADLKKQIPAEVPLALEPRNANFLQEEYFAFIKETGYIHVFSEKQYMPHIYDVYDQYAAYLPARVVIRLMGGDRKAMEEKSGERWNAIVSEQADKPALARMFADLLAKGKDVIVNVNNHYEGSAPLTIASLQALV